jgi:hypothetical protein
MSFIALTPGGSARSPGRDAGRLVGGRDCATPLTSKQTTAKNENGKTRRVETMPLLLSRRLTRTGVAFMRNGAPKGQAMGSSRFAKASPGKTPGKRPQPPRAEDRPPPRGAS